MARPIWKGSITFGLVNIPVQLEMAVRDKMVHFHMISKDGDCRLRRKLYCPDTGKEYDFGQTARGIEIGKGEYAIVDQSEINSLKPEHGQAIEISQFIKLEEVDPIYFDLVYYVTPTEASVKSYKLLHEAMARSERIALAQFVMRERQYLAAIRVLGEGLALHTMHYADEVLSLDDALPNGMAKIKAASKEVDVAIELIDSMTRSADLSEYHDEYREGLERLVDRKKHGKTVEVSERKEAPLPRTTNLMDALRRSLRSAGTPSHTGTRPAARPARVKRKHRARA